MEARGERGGGVTPVGCFVGLMYALSYYLVRRFRPLDAWLLTTSSGVAMISAMAALSGISLVACLMILMLAPTVTVVGYEVLEYRHQTARLAD